MQERGKNERIESHWFTPVVDPGRFSCREEEEPRKRRSEMEGKDDNIVTWDANLVGTLMDDSTTMKLDRRTSMNWKKIRSRSFAQSPFELSELYELIFRV